MHATCASSSATTWTDTRGCTAERSRTSAIDAIRLEQHPVNTAVSVMTKSRVVCRQLIAHTFCFPQPRTSHGQIGCWDTGGYAQLGWAKRKTSTHRIHLPILLPGALYSLPTTVWLSDTQLPTETLDVAAGWSSVGRRHTLELNITADNLAQTPPKL